MSIYCHETACTDLGICQHLRECVRKPYVPPCRPSEPEPPLDVEDVAEAALELAQAYARQELPIDRLVAAATALCRFELGFRPDDRESLVEQLALDVREGRPVTPESLAEHAA